MKYFNSHKNVNNININKKALQFLKLFKLFTVIHGSFSRLYLSLDMCLVCSGNIIQALRRSRLKNG